MTTINKQETIQNLNNNSTKLREIQLENDYLIATRQRLIQKLDIQKHENKALKTEIEKLYNENCKLRYAIEELKEKLYYKRHPLRLLKRFLKNLIFE